MATKLTSQRSKSPQCVCWRSGRRAMLSFFEFLGSCTCNMPDLVWDRTVLASKICPVCELCSFTINLAFHSSGPQTVSFQSHGLIFWTHSSWVAGKYIFYDIICRFCLILTFLNKTCQKYGEELILSKNKCNTWTHFTQTPLRIPTSFHCWGGN